MNCLMVTPPSRRHSSESGLLCHALKKGLPVNGGNLNAEWMGWWLRLESPEECGRGTPCRDLENWVQAPILRCNGAQGVVNINSLKEPHDI
jgi:hypothetical protein